MTDTLSISSCCVSCSGCSEMNPSRSQYSLGVHSMAAGHLTNGLDSAGGCG